MKNTTFYKKFIGFVAVLAVFSTISPVSAAYYYDQQGQPIYYDTYTVPGGQFYPSGPTVSYGYPTGNYGYSYNATYGYNTINGYNANGYNNRPPVIWSTPVRDAIDGQTYIAGINASDPDHDQLQYQLISGPAGMSIDPITGSLRWTNTALKNGQTFPVTVGVTDGRNGIVTQSYVITVRTYGGSGINVGGSSGAGNNGNNGSTSGSSGAAGKTGTASIFNIFSTKKNSAAEAIVIKDINIISGPKNINDEGVRNCAVYVTWNTNVATAGQVLYGTVSQQSVTKYAYPETAAEGNSFVKQHSVKLGCLNNSTYFLRVVAFSADDRAVSNEYTVFPVAIRMQIPDAARSSANVLSSVARTDNDSITAQLGRLLSQPILWIVIIVAVVWYVLLQILRRANLKSQRIKEKQAKESAHAPAHGAASAHGAPAMEIPMLSVPHH